MAENEVFGRSAYVFGSFTRPADTTAYASGDVISTSTAGGACFPIQLEVARLSGRTGMIRRIHVYSNDSAWANGVIRAHIYKSKPTYSNGDNAAWLTSDSGYLGYAEVTLTQTFSDTVHGIAAPAQGSEINFEPSGRFIYAVLESRSAVTPAASKIYTVGVEVLQN